jgi:hypothetical protein
MKLYIAYNGYTGDTAVHVIVLAKNEKQAYELASKKLEEASLYTNSLTGKSTHIYDENYWTNLEIELLCNDLSKQYVSETFE